MADFNETGVAPIQAGVSVKGPIHVPATQMNSGAPLAGAFAGFENLAKLGMNYMATEQKKDELKTVSDYSQKITMLADAVDQGVLTSAQAQTRVRALHQQYSASHPTLAGDFTKTTQELMQTAGLAKNVAEGTPQEKMLEEQTKKALGHGFIDPNRMNDKSYVDSALRNYLEFERAGEELKRSTEVLGNARARMGLEKDKVDYKNAVQSNQLGAMNLELKRHEVQANRALSTMGGTYTQVFSEKLATIQKKVRDGQMKPEDGIAAINNEYSIIHSTTSQLGMNAGSDKIKAIMGPMEGLRQTALDTISGKVSAEVAENQFKGWQAKSKFNMVNEDPELGRIVTISDLLGDANVVSGIISNAKFAKTMKNNTTPNGRIDDMHPKTEEERAGVKMVYNDVLKPNMLAVVNGKATEKQAAEVATMFNNTLKSMDIYKSAVQNPKEYNEFMDFAASTEFGKYVEKSGGVPADAGQLREVIRQNYEYSVLPLVQKKFKEAGIFVEPMGGYAGQDDAMSPVSRNVDVKFQGNGVVFVAKMGADATDKDAKKKAEELNREVGPIINRLVKMDAHFSGGRDYKKAWETNYAPLFTPEGEVKGGEGKDKLEGGSGGDTIPMFKFKNGKVYDLSNTEVSREELVRDFERNKKRIEANTKSGGPKGLIDFANETLEGDNKVIQEMLDALQNPSFNPMKKGDGKSERPLAGE
jgi:hypothetical protein